MNLDSAWQHLLDLWHLHPVGQTIGLVASAGYIIAALQQDDRKLFGIQLCGALCFALHYFLLGAWAGVGGYSVGAARNITVLFRLATPSRRLSLTLLFCSLYGAIAFYTYHQWPDLIPPLCGAITAIAFFNLRGFQMRVLQMSAQGLFIAYALYVGSIGGLITAVVELSFTLFTVTRLLRAETSMPQAP